VLIPGLGEVPQSLALSELDFKALDDGEKAFSGIVGFALAGVFTKYDTEFVLTDTGVAIRDNQLFRGWAGLIIAIKQGNRLAIRQHPNCLVCEDSQCPLNPKT
jgi:hypothetical protein